MHLLTLFLTTLVTLLATAKAAEIYHAVNIHSDLAPTNTTIQGSLQDCVSADVSYTAFANSTSPYLVDCWDMFDAMPPTTLRRWPEDTHDIFHRTCWLHLHLGSGDSIVVNYGQLQGLWDLTELAARRVDPADYPRVESFGDFSCGLAAVNFEIKRDFSFTDHPAGNPGDPI
ncbi:hypothetical protein QBC38DRAFT_461537 [Podospora fimiseda]|uniref:Ecp2 effector protein domain-containing protein n=1 Tax=Podospora fimiseda TaxID=252190 RepID=A0AAN6YLM6_9PEZI|nr:hypothetical protein QBC38DRAFT_461537 [Podospora fimiseda]